MGKKSTTSIETEIVNVTNNSKVALKQIVGAGRVEQYNMAVTYINRRPLTKEIIGSAIEWFTLSAEQGYPPALHALGIIYLGTYKKVGINKDVDKALEYFLQAIEHSSEVEQYHATSSETQYLEKVIDAHYRAGVIYKEQNKKEDAIKCLKFAAEKEHTDAPYKLGLIYAEDPETHDLALDYFMKAADQETPNKDTQYHIAMIYLKGRSDLRNSATAVSWFNKAIFVTVGRPHSGALYQLGLLFINGGEGITVNTRRGLELLIAAADEQGHMEAQYYLGRMYDEGRGVEKNEKTAVVYYFKAAEQGHREAQYYLGLACEEGRGGIDQDEAQALEWLTKSAEENPDAQFYLAVKYEEGRGVERNELKALEFLNKAIKRKHEQAKTYLLSLIERRIPFNNIHLSIKQLIAVTHNVLGEAYDVPKMFRTLIQEGIPELDDKVFYYYTYEMCSSQETIPLIKLPKTIYLYIENDKLHYQMLKYCSNDPHNEEVYSGILEVPAGFNLDWLKEVSFVNTPLLHKNIRQIYFDYNDSKTKCWYSVITDKGVKEVGGIEINPQTDTDEIDEDAIKSMLLEELKRNDYCFSKEDNLSSLKKELDTQLLKEGLLEPSYEKPTTMRQQYEEICGYENNFKHFLDKLIENLMHNELNNILILAGGEAFRLLKNNIIITAEKLKANQEEICRSLEAKFQDSSLMIDTFKRAYQTTINLEDFYNMACLMRQLNDFLDKLPQNQKDSINILLQTHSELVINNALTLFNFPTVFSAQFLTRRKMLFEAISKCFMKKHSKFYELEEIFVKLSGMASTSNMAYGSNNPVVMSDIQKKLDEENNLFKNICFNLIKPIWNLLLMATQQTEAPVIYDSLLTRQKPTILKTLSSLQDQIAKILKTENRAVFCPTIDEILGIIAKGILPQDEVEQILLEIVKEIPPADETESTVAVKAEEMLSLRVKEILEAEAKGILSPNAKKMLETLVGKIVQAKIDRIGVLTSNIKNTCDLNDIVGYLIEIVPLLDDLAVTLNHQKINLNTNKSRTSNLSDPSLKMSVDNTVDKFFLSSAPKKGDSRFRIFRRSENGGDLTIGGNKEFFENPLSESGPISGWDSVSTPSSSRSRSRRRSRADTNIKRLAVYSPRMVNNRDECEQSPKKSAPLDLPEQGANCLADSSKNDNHSDLMIGSSRNVQFSSPRIGSGRNGESPRIGSVRKGPLSPQIGSARNGELGGGDIRGSRSNTSSAADSSILDQRYSPNGPPCSSEQPPISSEGHKSSRFSRRLPFLNLGRSSKGDENGNGKSSTKVDEKEAVTVISPTLGK